MGTRQSIINAMQANASKTLAGSIENFDDFSTQEAAFYYLEQASRWANFRIDFLKYKTRQPFRADGGIGGYETIQQMGTYNISTVTKYLESNFSEAFGIELFARIMGVPEGIDKTKFGLVFKTENKKNYAGSRGQTELFQNRFSKNSPFLQEPNTPHLIDEQVSGHPYSMNIKKFTGIALDGRIRNGANEPIIEIGLKPVLLSTLTEGTYGRILELEPHTRTPDLTKSCNIEISENKQLVAFRLHGKKVAQKSYNFKRYLYKSLGDKRIRISHKIPFKIQLVAKVVGRHNDVILKDVFSGYIHFRGTARLIGETVMGKYQLSEINPNFSIDIIQ